MGALDQLHDSLAAGPAAIFLCTGSESPVLGDAEAALLPEGRTFLYSTSPSRPVWAPPCGTDQTSTSSTSPPSSPLPTAMQKAAGLPSATASASWMLPSPN